MKTLTGIVVKGYITRMVKEYEWEATLIELPLNADLIDGDAIPYYLKSPKDGKFYEFYGFRAPEGTHAYVDEENYIEEYFQKQNN